MSDNKLVVWQDEEGYYHTNQTKKRFFQIGDAEVYGRWVINKRIMCEIKMAHRDL